MVFYKFMPPFLIIYEEKYWFCSIMENRMFERRAG